MGVEKAPHEKYLSSQRGSVELVWAVTGGGVFSNVDHLQTLIEEIHDGNEERGATYETKIKGLVINLKGNDRRIIIYTKSKVAYSFRYSTICYVILVLFMFTI